MEVVYLYYNRQNDTFYYMVCSKNVIFPDVDLIGETWRFNSVLIQKLVYRDNNLYDLDYYNYLLDLEKTKKELKLKKERERRINRHKQIKKLINHLIDLLYKLKSKF